MLRPHTNRPILAYFDSIKNLRLRQLSLILKAGYDPNLLVNSRSQNGLQFMVNYFGATEAHYRLQAPANRAAYVSVARLLLDSGLDPNSIDLLTGESVIFDAIRFDDRDMVTLLLNYVDFSIRNKEGETALMCAARFGSKQTMRLILDHLRHLELDGYFLRQRNSFGLTPLELARGQNLACAKVLTKHLIAFGHHASAVSALRRSSSHHNLVSRGQFNYGASPVAGPSALVPAPGVLYDDSGSEEFGPASPPLRAIYRRRQVNNMVGLRGPLAAANFYDPRAAEFSQYLMEQRELNTTQSGEQSNQQHAQFSISDEEYEDAYYPGGGLTRSRSCHLGPVKQTDGQKFSTSKKTQGAGQGAELKQSAARASGNWDPTGAGPSQCQ